jgi:hypothetical protein
LGYPVRNQGGFAPTLKEVFVVLLSLVANSGTVLLSGFAAFAGLLRPLRSLPFAMSLHFLYPLFSSLLLHRLATSLGLPVLLPQFRDGTVIRSTTPAFQILT